MNKLKEALKNGTTSFGAWMQIPHPSVAEIIAHNSNGKLDWICIDMEHGSIDIETMTDIIRAIEKYDIVPVVRVPKNDYIWIRRVLDAGARGLIVPMVNSAEEAERAVSEALYAPMGNRSFGYCRANNFGANFDEYVQSANDEIAVIIQIEHIDAISNLPWIFTKKGIDGTFLGPYDLSGSLGVPGEFDNDRYKKCLKHYVKCSNENNVPMGVHAVRSTKEQIDSFVNHGYKMIAIGTDAVFLEEKCKSIFEGI